MHIEKKKENTEEMRQHSEKQYKIYIIGVTEGGGKRYLAKIF